MSRAESTRSDARGEAPPVAAKLGAVLLHDLVETSLRVRDTRARKKKIAMLGELLRQSQPQRAARYYFQALASLTDQACFSETERQLFEPFLFSHTAATQAMRRRLAEIESAGGAEKDRN